MNEPMSAPDDQAGWQELPSALQDLYNQLIAAYWAAATDEARDKVRARAEAISDLLSKINAAALSKRTGQYKQIQASLAPMAKELGELKDEIDHLIRNVKVAAQVANAIAKVAEAAAKVLT